MPLWNTKVTQSLIAVELLQNGLNMEELQWEDAILLIFLQRFLCSKTWMSLLLVIQ